MRVSALWHPGIQQGEEEEGEEGGEEGGGEGGGGKTPSFSV